MRTAADSLLPIIQSQRERFRDRAKELETVSVVMSGILFPVYLTALVIHMQLHPGYDIPHPCNAAALV